MVYLVPLVYNVSMVEVLDIPIITTVYYWQNGNAMVFDQYGHQMPEHQGRTVDVQERIEAAAPDGTEFHRNAVWPG